MVEKGNYIELIDISDNNFSTVNCIIRYIKEVKDKLVYMEVEDETTHKIYKLNSFQMGIRVLRIAQDKEFKQPIKGWNKNFAFKNN